MKLEVGNFHVKDIKFGEKTIFSAGILTVNKEEAIAHLNQKGNLKNIELYIVHPGDNVRILPTKAYVEPRFRPDERSVFPGYTGSVAHCGSGKLYALKDMCVIMCGKYGGWDEGMIDMTGPGAEHCVYAELINLVAYAEMVDPFEDNNPQKANTDYRLATHLLAEYIGAATSGQEPEDWEIFDLAAGKEAAEEKKLPRVAMFVELITQGHEGINDLILGRDTLNTMPILLHPNEIFDGAVLVGSDCPPGQSILTYDWQNLPILKRLYEEHGKTINLTGVVLYPSDAADKMKRQITIRSGEIASLLNLDAAVVVEWGGGNMDVDFFYLLAELEDRGIKTVGIMPEHGGKVMTDPKGDAIVCAGDSAAVIELPHIENVIGDLQCLVRDSCGGAWENHALYGPSIRPDGSLIVDMQMIPDSANVAGWSTKIVKDF